MIIKGHPFALPAPDRTDDLAVFAHGLGAVLAGLVAEAAVHRHTEVVDVARRVATRRRRPGSPSMGRDEAEAHARVVNGRKNPPSSQRR